MIYDLSYFSGRLRVPIVQLENDSAFSSRTSTFYVEDLFCAAVTCSPSISSLFYEAGPFICPPAVLWPFVRDVSFFSPQADRHTQRTQTSLHYDLKILEYPQLKMYLLFLCPEIPHTVDYLLELRILHIHHILTY